MRSTRKQHALQSKNSSRISWQETRTPSNTDTDIKILICLLTDNSWERSLKKKFLKLTQFSVWAPKVSITESHHSQQNLRPNSQSPFSDSLLSALDFHCTENSLSNTIFCGSPFLLFPLLDICSISGLDQRHKKLKIATNTCWLREQPLVNLKSTKRS